VYGRLLQGLLCSLPLAVGLGGLALGLTLLAYAGGAMPSLVKVGVLVVGACGWGAIVWGVVQALDRPTPPPRLNRLRPVAPAPGSLEVVDLARYRDRLPDAPWLN
jgi:hypothetical protein